MKTTYPSGKHQNMTNYERWFRGASGVALLTIIVSGVISSSVGTLVTTLIAVYLVMTAGLGSAPAYAVARAIPRASGMKRDRLATIHSI